MRSCCGNAGSCSCKIEAGRLIEVLGTGAAHDPLVIRSLVSLDAEDSQTFNLALTGSGSLENPWLLRVEYADSARLGDLPDVEVANRPNGYVLTWDFNQQKWIAAPPSVAAAGSISTGLGVDGDGSIGAPLAVQPDTARYIQVTASGVGLSDAGINRLIRVFADAPSRLAATPPPVEGTLSMLLTDPTRIDVYDGTDWHPVTRGLGLSVQGGQLLALSGAYAGGPITAYTGQVTETTDSTGALVLIPAEDLVGYSGVLSVAVQQVGTGPGWHSQVYGATNLIAGLIRRLDNGDPYAGATITATVTALLY